MDTIPNPKVRNAVVGTIFGGGTTNGADRKATNILGKGSYETVKQDQIKIARDMGVDPSSVEAKKNGLEISSPDGRVTVMARPTSGKELPTLEVQVKDESGNVKYKIKRRYEP
ncbi:MAG: hypothetical protein NVV74_21420 [Magnetospirillum sp.]|nr:hypothetical protein [Magnetospirillum sp.]